ncbi:hypothetical protein AT251_00130 [Enterovibrio nigricans]|nr:immunoglobulin-like domain-containing protein [Enterovibrio nigricans]PKF51882.1 hypothetical protein AT251_00130 [Enterovibrio nigricans]
MSAQSDGTGSGSDSSENITFTLSSDTDGETLTEGSSVTYTVTLDRPASEDLTVTLSNGLTVFIGVGSTSGAVTDEPREDDIFTQGNEDISVSIVGVSENDYSDTEILGTVENTITDDSDTTTFTLSSTTQGEDITEGGTLTYTVTLDNAANEDITVTLSNNQTVTIKAGELSGSVDVDVRADDLLQQDDQSLSVTIDGVSDNTFEDVAFEGTITNTVVDDTDTVFVKVFAVVDGQLVDANSISETNDAKLATYKAVLVDKDGRIINEDDTSEVDVSFSTLVNIDSSIDFDMSGKTITVALNTEFNAKALDDQFSDNSETFTVSANLTDQQISDLEGTYESVKNSQEDVTTTINDEGDGNYGTEDTVFVIIEASDDVTESDDAEIFFTVKLVDKNGDPVDVPENDSVTVNLKWLGHASAADFDDGFTFPSSVTIDGGQSESNVITIPVKDDNLSERHESVVAGVTGIQQDSFENVVEAQMVDGKPQAGNAADHALIIDEKDGDGVTIKLFMVDNEGNIVPATDGSLTEGDADSDTLQYMALPVDADGNILATFNDDGSVTLHDQDNGQVMVTLTESDDSAGSNNTDVTTQGIYNQTVALGQIFEVSAVDDHFAEGNESVTVSLGDVTGDITNTYEHVTVDGTVSNEVIDNDNPPVAFDDYDEKNTDLIFFESFELPANADDVSFAKNKWLVADEYNDWIITNGLEIQTGKVGGSTASEGNSHAELDSHKTSTNNGNTSVTISRTLDEGDGVISGQPYELTFDFKPRPSNIDDSDITFTFGDKTYDIVVENGVVTLLPEPTGNDKFGIEGPAANGWYSVTATTIADSSAAVDLSFSNNGMENNRGGYIDNIKVDGPQPYWINNDQSEGVNIPVSEILGNDNDPDGGTLSILIDSLKLNNPDAGTFELYMKEANSPTSSLFLTQVSMAQYK